MFHNVRVLVLVIITAIGSTLISQSVELFSIYASESSPYDSGYDHGCDDAGISDPDERYINQPERGPSFHTEQFMSGYNDGFNSCGGGGEGGFAPEESSRPFQQREPSQSEGIDWDAACQVAHLFLGLQTPCNELVNPDNTLTDQGSRVLLCYGGGLLLALQSGGLSALGSDQLARAAGCPK